MDDGSNSIAALALPSRSSLIQQLVRELVKLGCLTSTKLRFRLNGELVGLDNPDPRQLLVHWLRQSGYPGTTKVLQREPSRELTVTNTLL